MNIGDKLTWAYRSLFILMLVWLRFVDPYGVPSWAMLGVWAVILFFIFRKSRKKEEQTLREMQNG